LAGFRRLQITNVVNGDRASIRRQTVCVEMQSYFVQRKRAGTMEEAKIGHSAAPLLEELGSHVYGFARLR
jgi:hypothetical protein